MSVPLDDQTKSLLQTVPFFRELDEEALKILARGVIVRHYQAGETIFLEEEPFAGLHIVEEGMVKLYSMSERGREYVLMVLQTGDSCNEVPIIDGGPNPINLAAVEDTTVWVVDRETIFHLYEYFPALQDIITQNIALRCRQLIKQICRLSFLSVTGRLASFLLAQGEDKLSRHWTQEDLAAHLGTVREVVSRALRELQHHQLITIKKRRIHILNREGLEELAGM